jgi:hypothetical protein
MKRVWPTSLVIALACCGCKYDSSVPTGGPLPTTTTSPTLGMTTIGVGVNGAGGTTGSSINPAAANTGVQPIGSAGSGSNINPSGNTAGNGGIPLTSAQTGIAGSSTSSSISTLAGTGALTGIAGIGSFPVPGSP